MTATERQRCLKTLAWDTSFLQSRKTRNEQLDIIANLIKQQFVQQSGMLLKYVLSSVLDVSMCRYCVLPVTKGDRAGEPGFEPSWYFSWLLPC